MITRWTRQNLEKFHRSTGDAQYGGFVALHEPGVLTHWTGEVVSTRFSNP